MALEKNQIITEDAIRAPLELSGNLKEVARSLKEIIAISSQTSQALSAGNATQQKQRQVVDELTKANERLKKANSDVAKEIAKINIQTQERNKRVKQEAREALGLVGAYEKLTNELNDARKAYKDLAASGTATTKQLKEQERVVTSLNNKVTTIDKTVGQFQRNVGNYPRLLLTATNALRDFMSAFGLVGGITLFVGVLKEVVKINKDFEKSLDTLSSITGAAGKDLEFYKNEAIAVGLETGKSAKDVVEAYKLIGSAKADLLANKEALAAVTREAIILSQASGDDLPKAASALAAALNQFQLPATESARIINTLAAGSRAGAVEVPQITEAIEKFGSVARNANISIEESVAIIEAIGPAGLIGAEGGTKLRNILTELQKGADDTNPAVVGLETALENLARQNLTTTELAERFNIQNLTAIQTLIEQRHEVARLTKEVTGTNTAYEQASINVDNLDGDLDKLRATWEATVLSFSKGTGTIRTLVQALSGLLNIFRTINESAIGQTIAKVYELTNVTALMTTGWLKFLTLFRQTPEVLDDASKAIIETKSSLDQLKDSIKDINKELDESLSKNINQNSKEYLELLKFKLDQEIETNKRIIQDGNQTAKARIEASQRVFNIGKEIARLNKEIALKEEDLTVEEKILINERYLDEIKNLELKNANERKNILSKLAKDQLKELNNILRQRHAFEVRVAKETDKTIEDIAKDAQKRFEKNIDRRVEKADEEREKELKKIKEHEERKNDIIEASAQLANDIANGFFDVRQQRLANELAASQARRDAELEAAGDDERRKLQINQKFDKEQSKLKAKQARADKQNALFNIAIQTAQNIVRYFANPPLLALAIATGAVQAALVAARPIPKFWKGSESTPDTFIAGDRGRELVVHDGKAILSPDKATVFSGMPGAVVLPHPRTEEILGSVEDADISRSILRSMKTGQAVSWSRIEGQLDENNKLLRQIASRPIEDFVIDEKGFYRRARKKLSQLDNYYKRFGEWK